MSNDAPITKQDLRDFLIDFRKIPGTSGATNTGGSGLGGGAASNEFMAAVGQKFTSAVGITVDNLGKVAQGSFTTADALKLSTGAIGLFGTIGGAAAKGLQTMGDIVLEVNDTMKETGKVGVNFSNDMGEFNKQVKNAQLTMPEFQEIITSSSASIAGFGGGADASAKAFLAMTKSVQQSDIGLLLKNAGVSAKELADATVLSMYNSRQASGTDVKSKKEAADSAANLALELDDVARITGKSKQALIEQTKGILDQVDISAGIAMRFNGNEQAAQAAIEGIEVMSKHGQALAQYTAEIEAKGAPISKSAQQITSIIGTDLLQSINRYRDAVQSGDKARIEAAKADMETKGAEAAVRSQSNVALIQATYGTGEYAKTIGQLSFDAKASAAFAKKNEEELANFKKSATGAEAKKFAEMNLQTYSEYKLNLSRAGKELDANGREVKLAGANTAEAIRGLDNFAKVLTSTTSDGLKKLNDATGIAGGNVAEFSKKLWGIKTPDALEKKMTTAAPAIVQSVTNRAAANPEETDVWRKMKAERLKKEEEARTGSAPTTPTTPQKKFGSPGLKKEEEARTGSAPTTPTTPQKKFGSPGLTDFLNGSGDFNSIFENFGAKTNIDVHGEEFVGRKDQFVSLLNKMKSQVPDKSSLSGIAQTMSTAAPAMQTTASAATPTASVVGEVGNKDLLTALDQLNKGMGQLIHYAEETAKHTDGLNKTVKKGGNRLA
jgi:hypothetical protein